MEKINWKKLERDKKLISAWKKKYGTRAAINFSEGILGLKRGELIKNRPRIRRIIKKF